MSNHGIVYSNSFASQVGVNNKTTSNQYTMLLSNTTEEHFNEKY